MSQSDYLQYKRLATVLKTQTDLPPVLSSRQYTQFSAFALENSVVSTKETFERAMPPGAVSIFGIVRTPTACPVFPICRSTDLRVNRKPLASVYIDSKPLVPKKRHLTLLDSRRCQRENCPPAATSPDV